VGANPVQTLHKSLEIMADREGFEASMDFFARTSAMSDHWHPIGSNFKKTLKQSVFVKFD
jgi:hypothetical protein